MTEKKVVAVNFKPHEKITQEVLNDLTERVLTEIFDGKWHEVKKSYDDYCVRRRIRPNRNAHYDWAHEMLGTTTYQKSVPV